MEKVKFKQIFERVRDFAYIQLRECSRHKEQWCLTNSKGSQCARTEGTKKRAIAEDGRGSKGGRDR